MVIKKEFVLREIAGEYVLVPIGNAANEFQGLFPLSESGAKIWKMIPDAENADFIIDKLLEEYEIDRETLEADVNEFLDTLKNFKIID